MKETVDVGKSRDYLLGMETHNNTADNMTHTMNHAASPTKLRDGTWGALINFDNVADGDIVTITTRAGKSWDAQVVKTVYRGEGITVVTTKSLDRPAPRSAAPRRSHRGGCHTDGNCSSVCSTSSNSSCPCASGGWFSCC